MRKVILSMQLSLDGFVEGPDKAMDWMATSDDEGWNDMFERLESVNTFLLGRGMSKDYFDYWGSVLTDPAAPKNELAYARIADKTPHIVFSSSPDKPNWKNATVINGNIAEEVNKLKQQPGKNMVVWGGAKLASTFINLNLVDEYRLVYNPVILGGGKSLFSNVKQRHNLELTSSKQLKSGAVIVELKAKG